MQNMIGGLQIGLPGITPDLVGGTTVPKKKVVYASTIAPTDIAMSLNRKEQDMSMGMPKKENTINENSSFPIENIVSKYGYTPGQMEGINKDVQGVKGTSFNSFTPEVKNSIRNEIKLNDMQKTQTSNISKDVIGEFGATVLNNPNITIDDLSNKFPEFSNTNKDVLGELAATFYANPDMNIDEIMQKFPELSNVEIPYKPGDYGSKVNNFLSNTLKQDTSKMGVIEGFGARLGNIAGDALGALIGTAVSGVEKIGAGGGGILEKMTNKPAKAIAEGLKGTAIERWIQNGAVNVFGKEEVDAYKRLSPEDRVSFKTALSEDIMNLGMGVVDATTAYGMPIFTAAMGVAGDTNIGKQVITKVMEPTGNFVGDILTKTPGLKQYMESLPENRREEFKMFVGNTAIALAIGLKGKKNIYKNPKQFVIDNINPVQVARNFQENVLNMPSKILPKGKLPNIDRSTIDITKPVDVNLTPAIEQKIQKAIKPTVIERKGSAALQKFNNDVMKSIDTVVQYEGDILLKDADGNLVNRPIESIKDMGDALSQAKSKIFDQYDSLKQQAGEQGVVIDTTSAIDELKKAKSKLERIPGQGSIGKYIDEQITDLERIGSLNVEEAQTTMQTYNAKIDSFYRNPDPNSVGKAPVDAIIANNIRNSMNAAIEGATGSPAYQVLKDRYRAILNVEKDIMKRAVVSGRQNSKNAFDLVDMYSADQAVSAIVNVATGNIPGAVKNLSQGFVVNSIKNRYKKINSPDTNMKDLINMVKKDRNSIFTDKKIPADVNNMSNNSNIINNPPVENSPMIKAGLEQGGVAPSNPKGLWGFNKLPVDIAEKNTKMGNVLDNTPIANDATKAQRSITQEVPNLEKIRGKDTKGDLYSSEERNTIMGDKQQLQSEIEDFNNRLSKLDPEDIAILKESDPTITDKQIVKLLEGYSKEISNISKNDDRAVADRWYAQQAEKINNMEKNIKTTADRNKRIKAKDAHIEEIGEFYNMDANDAYDKFQSLESMPAADITTKKPFGARRVTPKKSKPQGLENLAKKLGKTEDKVTIDDMMSEIDKKGPMVTVYRGQDGNIFSLDSNRDRLIEGTQGTSFSKNIESAKNYGSDVIEGMIPKSKILYSKDLSADDLKSIKNDIKGLSYDDYVDGFGFESVVEKIIPKAKKLGKDAIDLTTFFPKGKIDDEIRVLDGAKSFIKK